LIHHEINRDYQVYDGIQYARADLTFNFFVAKTSLARKIRWEESIQVIFEHEDFFMAGYDRGMKVVYCPNSIVTHRIVELPTIPEYEKIRWNRQDQSKFFKKWDLAYVQDAQGRRLSPTAQEVEPVQNVPAPAPVLPQAEAPESAAVFGMKGASRG